MRVLTIAAQKGGQGKSTTCAHLAYAMREAGLRIAVIDMDPQASLSDVTFSADMPEGDYTPDAWFPVSAFLTKRLPKGYWTEDTRLLMINADSELDEEFDRTHKLDHLASNLDYLAQHGCDVALIDTQGGLSGLTRAALRVSTHVLMPFQFGGYDIAAIDKTIEVIEKIRRSENRKLKVMGMLPCRVQTGSRKVMNALADAQAASDMVLSLYLANRVAVQEATQEGRPVWTRARTGAERAAAQEWRDTCVAILEKLA